MRWQYRYKKTVTASEQKREEVAAAREQWQAWQESCDLSQRLCLDETGVFTDRIGRHGGGLGGARGRDAAPAGHWKTLTFMAGLRADRITAPWCVDRAIHGEAFKEYCRSQRGPTLKPGAIISGDNLPAHKVAKVPASEAQGATMNALPPYRPDWNPIGQVFARRKALLRQAAERTYENLWRTVGQLMEHFHADAGLNFFKNSGYGSD
ncbi:MAG: transposase [Methylobacter sp.]